MPRETEAQKSLGILRFKWYDSPNIRFFSIVDFESLCVERGFRIHERVALDTETRTEVTVDPNLNAETAIFALGR